MSHNLHLMPSYLRTRAAFEYSNTVTKRKKRKIKRWKRNKTLMQLDASEQRDPVDSLYAGNSKQMREFLGAMKDLKSGTFDLEDVLKWEALGGIRDDGNVVVEAEVDAMQVDTDDSTGAVHQAHPMIVASINDSLSRVEVHDEPPLAKPAKKPRRQLKEKKSSKEKIVDSDTETVAQLPSTKQKPRKPSDSLFGPKRSINHLFLVKRSHVKDLWGNRLSWSSTDKIFRVTQRFYKSHCTLSDNSFYVALQLSGNVERIVELLNCFSRQKIEDKQHSQAFLDGRRREVISMYDRKLDAPYGDVDVFFASADTSEAVAVHHWEQRNAAAKESDGEESSDEGGETTRDNDTNPIPHQTEGSFRSCLLWLHPASLPYAYYRLREESQMRNLHIQYRSDLCRFVMRGPHVSTVLCRNHILSVPHSHNHPDKVKLWQQIKEGKDVVAPHGMALSLKIRHPQFPDNALSVAEATDLVNASSQSGRPFTQDELTSCSRGSVTCGTDNLWKSNFYVKFDPKHDNATYNNKTSNKKQRKRIKDMTSLEFLTAQSQGGDASSKWFSTYFDILLLKHQTGDVHFGSGWDIICPREVAASLFYKLGKAHHVLLVPLVDQLRMQTEQGQMTFPFDYPDSHSFYTLRNEDFDEMVYKKKNIQKKWADIFKDCGVQDGHALSFVGRHERNDERGMETAVMMVDTNTTVFYAIHLDFAFGQIPIRKGHLLLPRNENHLKQILADPRRALPYSPQFKTVGFITSGIHSLHRGKGFAVGYARDTVCRALRKGKFTVLLYWDPENSKDHVYAVKCFVQ